MRLAQALTTSLAPRDTRPGSTPAGSFRRNTSRRDTSRPEAEQRLRRRLALQALAAAEAIEVAAEELEAKVKEVRRGLSQEGAIDPERLHQVVADDLLRDKLLAWLEENSTISAKPPAEESTAEQPSPEEPSSDEPAAAT